MKNALYMILLLAFCAIGFAEEPSKQIFVAVDGNDANAGTIVMPFATLQRAQLEARKVAGRGPTTICIRGGTYYIPQTFVLTAEDSGTKDAPVAYQNYLDEEVVISGGSRLIGLKWEPYKNGIMQTKVPADLSTDQLFVNGALQTMARYPNFNANERIFNGFAADAISPARAALWKNPAGGFIHAMHAAEWGGMHYLITGKDANNKLSYIGGWQNNRPMGMHGQHRFVENIFEELDAPGEWFLNSDEHTLYYYPLAGLDLATATIVAVRLKHLVEFRGTPQAPVQFITMKGITFRHAARTFMENKEPLLRTDWTTYRGGAIYFNGAEDCALVDSFIDQVGGNAVFVNNYNRRVTIRGCQIAKAGGNGIAFIGDPNACYNPINWNQRNELASIDKTPGPKTNNYPAECLVEDCLIYLIGRVEKQTAGVSMDMSQNITVRHCSIYDVPRAGINIGDGCWGGHVIEFCDVFDTVKETGDHGSFNSWGRDRFWGLGGLNLNNDPEWEAHKSIVTLDAVKPNILRNSRWRCDHGWDIDLDDGSTNYEIRNNLCLNGGIKNREGFVRVVENNVIINSGFHPHVWFKHSEDIFRHNIMSSDHYLPAGGMPSTPWGKEMDYNFVHRPGITETSPAAKLMEQSKRDEHSSMADAQFIDPASGNFNVKESSPALKLGFVNFPMDQFGVQKPSLKSIARTPEIPGLKVSDNAGGRTLSARINNIVFGTRVRDISGLGDRSAYGLPAETGVLLIDVPESSAAAKAGFRKDDVIIACNDQPVKTVNELNVLRDKAAGKKLTASIIRKQGPTTIEILNYAYVVAEFQQTTDFKSMPLLPISADAAQKISSQPATSNDPIGSLIDCKVLKSYGAIFGNGVLDGMYKLDLGSLKPVNRVDTYSFHQNSKRGPQRFALYGSHSEKDPGWNVLDAKLFTPVISVETPRNMTAAFAATSVRLGDGAPLGKFRWLVWAVAPIDGDGDSAENTAYQEMQVLTK